MNTLSQTQPILTIKEKKIKQFRMNRKIQEKLGKYDFICKFHSNLKALEFKESVEIYNPKFTEATRKVAGRNPTEGHEFKVEMRTKMIDWMVEVESSFKCTPKTYFLTIVIFD
jgi:hypothetical protein